MSPQQCTLDFVELTPGEARDLDGGIVFAAPLVLAWMGKAFVAGVVLGAGAATAYLKP